MQREGRGRDLQVRAGVASSIAEAGGAHARGGADGLDVLASGRRHPRTDVLPAPEGHARGARPARRGRAPPVAARAVSRPDLPPPSARPARIVNVDDVEPEEEERGEFRETFRQLGRAAGSFGQDSTTRSSGRASSTVAAWPLGGGRALRRPRRRGNVSPRDEELAVRRGHVCPACRNTRGACLPRRRTALTLLLYGTREPNDRYTPGRTRSTSRGRSDGADRTARYWDGESIDRSWLATKRSASGGEDQPVPWPDLSGSDLRATVELACAELRYAP